MTDYKIGCDAHKRFSQFAVRDATGRLRQEKRIEHKAGAIREFLSQFPSKTWKNASVIKMRKPHPFCC